MAEESGGDATGDEESSGPDHVVDFDDLVRRRDEAGSLIILLSRRWYHHHAEAELAGAVQEYEEILRVMASLRPSTGRGDVWRCLG